jgi:hypothetical protein
MSQQRRRGLGASVTELASSFVHFHQPAPDICGITLDLAHLTIEQVLHIEDRLIFVQFAQFWELGVYAPSPF